MRRIEVDWEAAGLNERRMEILRYAVKLTTQPGNVAKSDIDRLEKVGLSDRDILDICEVTAYYAYVNRIAAGLGVEVEEWLPND